MTMTRALNWFKDQKQKFTGTNKNENNIKFTSSEQKLPLETLITLFYGSVILIWQPTNHEFKEYGLCKCDVAASIGSEMPALSCQVII